MSQENLEKSLFVDENGTAVIEEKQLPGIYIFTNPEFNRTNGMNSTKVGYTVQVPHKRTDQWRKLGGIYEDLIHIDDIPALFKDKNGENIYFMDHSVHKMMEQRGYEKLINVPGLVERYPNEHISREFYFNKNDSSVLVTKIELNEYVEQLRNLYNSGDFSGIKFYKDFRESAMATSVYFEPVNSFPPRAFQQNFINNAFLYFTNHFESDSKNTANYLLSAPTRSGKSFMSAMLSKELMDYLSSNSKKRNLVLVVSGIADVGVEWQETYEAHKALNQRDKDKNGTTKFNFITREKLIEKGQSAINDAYDNGAENVVVFLTLQDLSGSFKGTKNDDFKAHDFLKPVNGVSPVDFMIVDEAHFAAFNRYGEYRSMIARSDFDTQSDAESNADKPMDQREFEESVEEFQSIIPTLGTLYVSATPYNEIINSSMFSIAKKHMTIISKQDIKNESEKWSFENPDAEEWKSPYYGLPSPHYFAVDTGKMIGEILSVDEKTTKFIQFNSAHSLIWNFFGYKFENDFLFPAVVSDPVYRSAGLGNHIIISVANCATADAVEESLQYLKDEHSDFDFKVMNVSSENSSHYYRTKRAYDIKREIDQADADGVKTVVITVDRLTTGVTVKQWDTVVFWRNMSSAQKHDQLSGRNGTPFVVSMKDSDGNIVKRVEKQNVAIISYAPEQMLEIAYQTAVTMARVKQGEGVSKPLKEMIEDELNVSPTYVLSGGDHMVRMNATNILDTVLSSQKGLGPREYAEKVSLDISGLTTNADLVQKIMQISADDSNLSISLNAFEMEEIEEGKCQFVKGCEKEPVDTLFDYSGLFCYKHLALRLKLDAEKNKKPFDKDDFEKGLSNSGSDSEDEEAAASKREAATAFEEAEKERKSFEKRIRNFVSILLMFVALSNKAEHSLEDVISSIEDEQNKEGQRIAKHLGIDVDFLKELRDKGTFNYTLDAQFYLIDETLNKVDENSTIDEVWDAVAILVNGFGNFSRNEVPTPGKVAELVVDKLELSERDYKMFANNGVRVIDNGCKSTVVLVEFARRAVANDIDPSKLDMFAVPTSPATYELIRKVYELLGWNLENIYFVEGLDNLDTLLLLEMALEKKECLRDSIDDCPFHGNSDIAKKARKEILGKSVSYPKQRKKDSDSEYDLIISNLQSQIFDDSLENLFDKIVDEQDRVLAIEFWEKLVEDIKKFDYVISNPPYQLETGTNYKDSTRKSFTRVFDQFQLSASVLGTTTSMIYPASWQSSIVKGFGKDLINSGLSSVTNYNGSVIFAGAIKENYPVSIVNCTQGYTGAIKSNDIILPRDSAVWIDSKSKAILLEKTGHLAKIKSGVFDLTDLKNIESTDDISFSINPKDFTKPVKFYIKKTAGTAADGGFYYAEKSKLANHYKNPAELDKYNVSIQSMFFKQIRNFKEVDSGILKNFGARISMPDEGFSTTWSNIVSFETKKEAENFVKYFNSKPITVLAVLEISRSRFGAFVPDLEDYTDNNPNINWNEPLDPQLYKLFNLTEEEIKIIEES